MVISFEENQIVVGKYLYSGLATVSLIRLLSHDLKEAADIHVTHIRQITAQINVSGLSFVFYSLKLVTSVLGQFNYYLLAAEK